MLCGAISIRAMCFGCTPDRNTHTRWDTRGCPPIFQGDLPWLREQRRERAATFSTCNAHASPRGAARRLRETRARARGCRRAAQFSRAKLRGSQRRAGLVRKRTTLPERRARPGRGKIRARVYVSVRRVQSSDARNEPGRGRTRPATTQNVRQGRPTARQVTAKGRREEEGTRSDTQPPHGAS
jgi:hypothetical protein